jgi:Kdo2-lipid IVA lauroyltransferase/acyltransferase
MPKHLSFTTRWGQYLAARLAVMGLTALDVNVCLDAAAGIGGLMHRVDKRHRKRASAHIRMAFPELSDAKLDKLVLESFEHFMQLIVEVCHTPRLVHRDSWSEHVTVNYMGKSIALMNAGRPVILLTGHVGNWEMLGTLMAVLGYRMEAIARPLDNPLVNDWLMGIREKRGTKIITKWDATDRMLSVLNDGGSLGFIADQNAGDKGMFVPFFGRLASTYKSIGLLAISQNTPIVCGYAQRVGRGFHYEMGTTDVIMPDEWEAQPDPLYYVTARYMRAIEAMVRANPPQYLWMHRRWKSRPRFERENKPMPATLRRGLEQLPWMTEELLAQVQRPVHAA